MELTKAMLADASAFASVCAALADGNMDALNGGFIKDRTTAVCASASTTASRSGTARGKWRRAAPAPNH